MKEDLEKSFLDFLLSAKQVTYAAQGDDASVTNPLLSGTRQLEWRSGDWFYRDIYAGLDYFVGQEIVYQKGDVFWSMAYAGGVGIVADAALIYRFLRAALRQPDPRNPLRGPEQFIDDNWAYRNTRQGDWRQFQGSESITHENQQVYSLLYGGGCIR